MNDLAYAAVRSVHTAPVPVPATTNGARVLIDTLVELGVEVIFGYPGGAILPVYDALHGDPRLRHVLVRHEQAAVHAAEGYARSTGKLGVVVVTSGPGVSNTITGLLDAMSDSIPVLCISGQVSTALIGTDAFQECDALGLSRTVTKWNTQLRRVDDIAATVRKAVGIATQGRPGPVLLDFPKDIQLAATAPQPAQQPERVNVRPLRGVPRAKLVEAVDLIRRAKRPVFYGGGGLVNAGPAACEAFTQLVRRTGAPCTLTLMGLGAFPASDGQFLGMLGMHGTLEANLAMHHADLVVCIGARFDDRVTAKLADFCPEAKKIHVDVDACSINKLVRVDVPIVGDCAQVVPDLVEVLGDAPLDPQRLAAWWETIALWRDRDSLGFEDRDDVIVPQRILRSLNERLLGRDAIVATDVGQHQMWAAQHLGFDAPRRWLTSGGAGTMGYGLPAAIGAQIAHPDKPVVCVSGDASLLMNLQELSTAMQHRTPVKLIVVNNGRMGMVRQWQDLIHGGRQSHSWTEALPDFVAVAKGFGWASRRAESPAELEAALDECLASDGPFLLDVVVPTGENCFPMIPPGRGHQEVVLNEEEYRALP